MKSFGRITMHEVLVLITLVASTQAWGKIGIIQEEFTVDSANPEYVDLFGRVVDGNLYVSYNIKKVYSKDFQVAVDVYNHNGKKFVPVTVPGLLPKQNYCDFLKNEKMFIPFLMSHFQPPFESCPFPVGWANLTKYSPNPDTLPPMLPTGQYKVAMTFGVGSVKYYVHSWIGRITNT